MKTQIGPLLDEVCSPIFKPSKRHKHMVITPRVQVRNDHILAQNLPYNYYNKAPGSITGYMNPQLYVPPHIFQNPVCARICPFYMCIYIYTYLSLVAPSFPRGTRVTRASVKEILLVCEVVI